MEKQEKKVWSEPVLMEISGVTETAECASGNADVLTCSSGNSANFQCLSGNSPTFSW